MNPLASIKCASRVLVALAAVSGVIFAVGCGSSNSAPPVNPVGFTNGSLTGTYVFSSQGLDSEGLPLSIAGALTSDGNQHITGGTIDIVDVAFDISPNTPPSVAAQTITSGSYTVGSDGRGQAQIKSLYGTYVLNFVLISTSHGLVTEFDGNGGGSGTIDLQTVPSSLAGSYAFSLAGSDGSQNLSSFAAAGAFTLNSGGTVTAGVEDFNDSGAVINEPLTGSATLGSGTAPGSIALTTSSFPLAFDFYPIDSTHFKLIETDYNAFLSGDVFTQPSTSIPTGTMAFTMEGGISAPVATGGFLTYNGTSFSGSEDFNNNGTVVTQAPFSGNAGAAGPVGGRVVVGLTGFSPANQWVVYPSSGGLLMLETDAVNLSVGAAYTQQAGATLPTSQSYGLNLSAFNTSGPNEEDDIAQFTTNSAGFGGVVDINDNFGNGTVTSSQALSGTFPTPIDNTGRGQATTTANGATFVSFFFYAVNSNTFLLLESDTNQIGAGTFELQSTPGAAVAHPVVSLFRPAARSHGALQHKK
jgi:hypothetical protein